MHINDSTFRCLVAISLLFIVNFFGICLGYVARDLSRWLDARKERRTNVSPNNKLVRAHMDDRR